MSIAGDYSAGKPFRDRGGDIVSIIGNNPGAGAEASFTVPAGQGILFKGFRIRLVTSAVVANRVPVLTIADDNANTVLEFPASAAQVASTTIDYNFIADLGYAMGAAVGGKLTVGISPLLYLPDGWTVKTVTQLIDVGDDYAAPTLIGERVI